MNIYLDESFEYLHFKGLIKEQTLKSLRMCGIKTIEQLLNYKKMGCLNQYTLNSEELLDIKSFLYKLENGEIVLLQRGSIQSEYMNPSMYTTSSSVEYDKYEFLTFSDSIAIMAYSTISKLHGPEVDFFRELFPDAERMADTILNGKYDVLTIYRDLGRIGNIELRKLLLHYLKTLRKFEFLRRFPDKVELNTIEELIRHLSANICTFPNEVILQDFLSGRQRRKLMQLFDTLTSNLSAGTHTFQRKHLPTFNDAMRLFGMAEAMMAEGFGFKPGRVVTSEIWFMVQALEDAFDEEAFSGEDIWLQKRITQAFPWLSPTDHRFVFRYYLDNDSAPLFYIMMQMIKNSREKAIEIWAHVNGILDGKKHTFVEVGNANNMTRERIRQITQKGNKMLRDIMKCFVRWGGYTTLMASNYITELSPKYRMIQEEEHLPQNFNVFCTLLTALGDYEVIRIGDKEVAVHQRILQYVHIKNLKNQLELLSKIKYSKDLEFDLHSLLADVPSDLRDDAFWILCQIAQAYTNLSFDENGKVVFKQNYVDVGEEAFHILKEYGKPMSLEALFREFKRRHPDHRFTEPDQFRMPMLRNKHIKSIGKSGTYGLDSWENVFFGNIRDLLRITLEASPKPIHIDKLTKIVKRNFRTTNAKSIASSMAQDNAKDFVLFQNGYYGLVKKRYPSKYKRVERTTKITFNERLKMLEKFISTYHRFPFARGGDIEQTLQRWLYNVERGVVDLDTCQREKLKTVLQPFRDAHLPENEIEETFLDMCHRYKSYIDQEYELPNRLNGIELYDWMNRSKANYNSYIDNRRQYLTDLFNYITSLGFSI